MKTDEEYQRVCDLNEDLRQKYFRLKDSSGWMITPPFSDYTPDVPFYDEDK